MVRSLRLVLVACALALATLAPAGLAQGPTPITSYVPKAQALALAFVKDSQGDLVAIVGEGPAAATGLVAAIQSCPTIDPTNLDPGATPCAVVPITTGLAHIQSRLTEEQQDASDFKDAMVNLATLAAQKQLDATTKYVTGIAAGYLQTVVNTAGTTVLLATNSVHHAQFTFTPELTAATQTIEGKDAPDPSSEIASFPGGSLAVTAAFSDATGAALSYRGTAHLVLTSSSGIVRTFGGVIDPLAPAVATFKVSYAQLGDSTANQTSWTMRVEAPRIRDGPTLLTPYAVANYNSLANDGSAASLADQLPTHFLVPTDRIAPTVQAVSNFVLQPLRSNLTRNIDVLASDNIAVAKVLGKATYQDLRGRLHNARLTFAINTTALPANSTAPLGTRYVGNVTPPPGMARLYYLVTAIDVGGNRASVLESVDLPLPPATVRPAPAVAPLAVLEPAQPAANTTTAPAPPALPAQPPAAPFSTADPPATVVKHALAPASSGVDTVEASVGVGVTLALFGLPMLLFYLTRL